MNWTKKKKGCAIVYTSPENDHAIVDRRGFGASAAMGENITYRGIAFDSAEAAKKYAETSAK
ncbi:hypothetical protein B0E33_01390 [Roseibium algicola]|uniref:ETC complex I subunit-like protein n=1 Tax=Roseibium algicola TaxID=2857014 RepID=A0ABN4WPF4_9HYPH|nr:hypothetical protein [Roseibium aggregatum]AQQ02409.1 hypothetical protein B0E33_01390 [Roseibium aggregatum]